MSRAHRTDLICRNHPEESFPHGDCVVGQPIPTIDGGEYGGEDDGSDGTLFTTRATSTRAWKCTLCGADVSAGLVHLAWTWEDPDILRGHVGCVAVQREIDIDSWEQGTLAERVREWASNDGIVSRTALAQLDVLRDGLSGIDQHGADVLDAAEEMIREEIAERAANEEEDEEEDDPDRASAKAGGGE